MENQITRSIKTNWFNLIIWSKRVSEIQIMSLLIF